jgi:ZIP family zinc transporter
MMASGLLLASLGVAAGLATFAGGSLALRLADRTHLILGFSAGAVIGVALLDLLPECMELAGPGRAQGIASFIAAGFILYLVVDRTLLAVSGGSTGHRGHFGAASLTAHSFLDGLGIGLGFQASPAVGAVLAAAVLAHDFADGINTVNLSLAGSRSPVVARRGRAADAIAPLLGIGASTLIRLPTGALGSVLALFAGFFLYIGASELLPESHHRHPRATTTMAAAAGVVLIGAVVRLAG